MDQGTSTRICYVAPSGHVFHRWYSWTSKAAISKKHHTPWQPPPAATAASGVVARQPCHKVSERRVHFGLPGSLWNFASCTSSLCWLHFVKQALFTIYNAWFRFNLKFPSTPGTPKKMLDSKFLKWFRASLLHLETLQMERPLHSYLKVLFKPAFCILLLSFDGPVAGFQTLSFFFRRGTANQKYPKVTASRPSDATMSPKTSAQKDPKEHAVHVKRQRPGWFGWRALHFSWPWEPTSGLCTINKNWSMGIVASSPGNASIGHLQPSTGDRISRHLALLVWKLHLLLGIAAKKWIPNWVKCLSVWDDSRVDEPAKWIMEKEHGSWVKLAFCLHVLACVDLLTIFPTISQELNLPLVGPKLLPHFGSAYRLGTLFSHMPTNTHSERHRPLSGPKPNRGSRSTRTERLE